MYKSCFIISKQFLALQKSFQTSHFDLYLNDPFLLFAYPLKFFKLPKVNKFPGRSHPKCFGNWKLAYTSKCSSIWSLRSHNRRKETSFLHELLDYFVKFNRETHYSLNELVQYKSLIPRRPTRYYEHKCCARLPAISTLPKSKPEYCSFKLSQTWRESLITNRPPPHCHC